MIIYVAGDECHNGCVRLAQLDRAFGYGPKGRGFESSNARYCVKSEKAFTMGILAFFCFFDESPV